MSDDEPFRVPIEDSIDLHAFAPRDVVSVVEEYLHEAQQAGFTLVRLIHGRGKGVQRAAIQQRLADHPLVNTFYDAAHLGATVVMLRERASGSSRLLKKWNNLKTEDKRKKAKPENARVFDVLSFVFLLFSSG